MPRGKIVLGLMLATIIIAAHHHALSQQFPYAAPQAPEFDDRGNLRGPGQSDAEPSQRIITPAPRTRERTGTQAPPGFGVVTPYAPEVTAPSQSAPPPQYGVTTPYAPEVAAPYAP